MTPAELSADSFRSYPAQGRKLAGDQVTLLRELPIGFVPLLLKELIGYDWKFPAERAELDRQLVYLGARSASERKQLMADFAKLRIPSELQRFDWVNLPAQFSEQLTSELWASHQIDSFRAAATDYIHKVHVAAPREILSAARVGIVVLGEGAAESRYRLFRKLRPHGVYFSRVNGENGVRALTDYLAARAQAYPVPYGHWYIDGGDAAAQPGGLTCVSYDGLSPVRSRLEDTMQRAYSSGMGPEAFRTMLAKLKPEDLGGEKLGGEVMSRFQVSLLTEGAGTQVFSTTFVQWAAREALRRAEPVTLLARFRPRQQFRPMNELLADSQRKPKLDAQGSLIDADMGAYYTWLNQQRLDGADRASFLAWYEGHNEAIAIGPSLGRGTESKDTVHLTDLLKHLA